MWRNILLGTVFFVFAVTDPDPVYGRKRAAGEKGNAPRREAGENESENGDQKRSSQLQIQALQEQVNSLEAKLQSAARAAEGREETLRVIDQLKARIKQLSERVSATRARLADAERRRAERAQEKEAVATGWQTGYDRGFFWQSPEKRFRLKMDGYLIAQYGMALVAPLSDELSELSPYGWPDRHGFDLVKARLGARGHLFSPKLRYKLRLEMAGSPRLTHAFLSWQPFEMMRITAGQMKVPNSYQYLQSSGRLQLGDRSVATNSFASGYDQGLRITLRQWGGKLFEQVGVFNGSGKNRPNDNMALHYVLRVGTQPLGPMPRTEDDPGRTPSPRLHFGASVGYHKPPAGDLDGDGVVDDKQAVQVGGEAAFAWKGLSASADFHYRLEDHREQVEDECPAHYGDGHRSCDRFQDFWGAYGQVGYYVWGGIQVAGRYGYTQVFDERFNPNSQSFARSYRSVQALTGLTPEEVHEATGGISYDLYRHNIRVGLYYSWYWERGYRLSEELSDESRQVHWVRLQTRLVF